MVSGPVVLPDPSGVTTIHVETARQMLEAVEAALPADVAVMAAAVSDWRAQKPARAKIKKDGSVVGDLTTARIMIEDGAYFKGAIEIERQSSESSREVSQPAFARAVAPAVSAD